MEMAVMGDDDAVPEDDDAVPGDDEARDNGDVCVLIPTLDEAETIAEVIDGLHDQGYENVLIIDGGSTDGTGDIAHEHGARVERQSGSGKGSAVREALSTIDAEYVLMLDGDGTYRAEDADAMLEPLRSDRAEHVIGDRFADMEPDAMPRLNRAGNRLINRAFAFIHGRDLVDITSGYRAFTRTAAERFHLTATGFGIETEFAVECVKRDIDTEIVPITYRSRPAGSDTNLRPIRDGAVILVTLYRLAKTNNPLFYFGSVGVLSLLLGGTVGAYVGVEWVTRGISHEVLAVVAGVSVIFGVQLLMFGVLSDMMLSLHREQLRRIERSER
jgi:dolichol-phosphate mannosyltransferase